MFSTYKKDDVILLLKDITGLIEPLDTITREKKIQRGVHYSEMLPIEYEPSLEYMNTYHLALDLYSDITASAVVTVSEKIFNLKGKTVVLVSLARAGTSIGVLIKRYLRYKYDIDVPHFTISIIRDKGIDRNAMQYILNNYNPKDIQFIDGWIGKGAISRELKCALMDYEGVSPELAVLSDPTYITNLSGTNDDFLIPSCCLNATISGLISRTFLRHDIIKDKDYHGCIFYKNLISKDETYNFIELIVKKFNSARVLEKKDKIINNDVDAVRRKYNILDINLIKPGIGETIRVLLRRQPWKILVTSYDDSRLKPIYVLAKEKNISLELFPLKKYLSIGLIKNIKDT